MQADSDEESEYSTSEPEEPEVDEDEEDMETNKEVPERQDVGAVIELLQSEEPLSCKKIRHLVDKLETLEDVPIPAAGKAKIVQYVHEQPHLKAIFTVLLDLALTAPLIFQPALYFACTRNIHGNFLARTYKVMILMYILLCLPGLAQSISLPQTCRSRL